MKSSHRWREKRESQRDRKDVRAVRAESKVSQSSAGAVRSCGGEGVREGKEHRHEPKQSVSRSERPTIIISELEERSKKRERDTHTHTRTHTHTDRSMWSSKAWTARREGHRERQRRRETYIAGTAGGADASEGCGRSHKHSNQTHRCRSGFTYVCTECQRRASKGRGGER